MRLGKSWRNFPSDKMEHLGAHKSNVLRGGKRDFMGKYAHHGGGIRLGGGNNR